MSRTLISLATLCTFGGAAALASCAPVAEPGPKTLAALDTSRQCFFTRNVNGFSEAPDGADGKERIYVNAGPSKRFVVEPVGTCHDIDFAEKIVIADRYGPSLCTGDTVELVVPSSIGNQQCLARVIGKVAD